MNVSIHYCYGNREHDQDGDSMIKVYSPSSCMERNLLLLHQLLGVFVKRLDIINIKFGLHVLARQGLFSNWNYDTMAFSMSSPIHASP